MTRFNLPDLGEGLVEAEIVAWHVAVGDHVVTDQPLVSIETDKALVEIPSPQAGHVQALHGEVGDTIKVGDPLVEFEDEGRPHGAESVIGDLPHLDGSSPPSSPRTAAARPARAGASPAARALARRLGIDLSTIQGSGPDGTVTRADVFRTQAGLQHEKQPEPEQETGADDGPRALRGVRRAMARSMRIAHQSVVPASLTELADIGDWPPDTALTPRLIRALVNACREEPALNAWFLDEERGIRRHRSIHLGIAAETDDGLLVPVMRDADKLSETALIEALETLKHQVQERTLPPSLLRGATITLSNFGMYGGLHAALVVTPPQIAILGAGRAHDSVVATHGSPCVRRVLPLSLTFDHRAATGAEAARFMIAVKTDLESAQ